MPRYLLLSVVWVFCVGVAATADSPSPPPTVLVAEDPLERATLEIAKDLRCAVCQNQPISESNSDLARDMRAIIREQLQAGKSRDEIVDYFVARYGDYVLLKPPFHLRGLLLWLGPPLLLAIVGAVAWFVIRRRAAVPTAPPAPLSPADHARISAARREQ
jgi:cytochrome c-type biogenesis protein CcmH